MATEACSQDAMGYGTVTDYFARDAVPQVSCQMHYRRTVCTVSNMLAGPYCPPESLAERGLVVLPLGHPLERFAGTGYSDVLAEYLGSYATIRFTDSQSANAALLDARTCAVHQHPGGTDQGILANTLLPDANNLMVQASNQLAALLPGSPQHAMLQNAINQLNAVIAGQPTLEQLASAMGQLTQAMAAAQ